MFLDGLDELDQKIVQSSDSERQNVLLGNRSADRNIAGGGEDAGTGSGTERNYRGIYNNYQSPENQRCGFLLF